MDIRFFYQNNQHSYKHEIIITSFTNAVAKVIELPNELEVCLYSLGGNMYGGIDKFRVNRIGIDYDVPFMILPKVLTHELIHVHQKHKGLLKITRDDICYWHGIAYTEKLVENMTYEEYENLPWELDVKHKLDSVFSQALKLVS